MAIYHLHVKNISRSAGRSVVAAAAYRAGETLPNEAEERLSAFGGRRDVLHCEIMIPANAPAWMADRARLWNAVEATEKRKDARLAKEIEVALPRELAPAAWVALSRKLAAAYTAQGFVTDFAIHDDGTAHNPHVHMLLTTRIVQADGFGGKIRAADERSFINDARALWADIANKALAEAGMGVGIDPRSHARAGVQRAPGEHRGPNAEERRSRREKMGLSRILARKVSPASHEDTELLLKDWPRSQMKPAPTDGTDLPVPGPDGRPISQDELDSAQERMLADMGSQMPMPDEGEFRIRRWSERSDGPAGNAVPTPREREERFMARRWREDVGNDREPVSIRQEDPTFRSGRWDDIPSAQMRDEPDDRDMRDEPTHERGSG